MSLEIVVFKVNEHENNPSKAELNRQAGYTTGHHCAINKGET